MWTSFASKAFHFRRSGPALVLSMFSFVGFESATTLGAEARDPLRTIPRAVIQCAVLAGIFFMLCSYSEVLRLPGESGRLSESTSPLHLLAAKAGLSPLGVAIDFGALISMVACVLACTTAAARVLMRMAHGGLLPSVFERTNPRHGTPGDRHRGLCRPHVRFHRHDVSARCVRRRNIRLGRVSFSFRLSHSVRTGRCCASVRPSHSWPAFKHRNRHQPSDDRGSDSHCNLRSPIHI